MAKTGPKPKPVAERFWSRVRKGEGDACWLWTRPRGKKTGPLYGKFMRYVDRGNGFVWRPVAAHRFSWELANGPIPDGLFVLHRCDNPPCVRPDHLFLGTGLDNSRDMVAKGRSQRFERHWNAKLSIADVLDMRRALTELIQTLADRYGIDTETVITVLARHRWKGLDSVGGAGSPDRSDPPERTGPVST